MPVTSPVSHRLTVTGLLLLTFGTGMIDAISVLVLGHVFVANMTGNVIFLGFWFVPHTVVDMTAAVVAFVSFLAGAVIGGRFARHLEHDTRRWVTVALGIQELSTTVLTSTIVGIGMDSRLAGGKGDREKLRFSVVLTMCAGAVVGATMSRFTVAPVIALVAALVAVTAVLFWFGPPVTADD
jgi:uncharacterized membrane protein YoaK (UPF0700 family)